MNTMTPRMITALMLAALGFSVGCADREDSAEAAGVDDIDQPDGFAFVQQAVAISDVCAVGPAHACAAGKYPADNATTTAVSQPEPGKLCLTGKVSAHGHAGLVLVFTKYSDQGVPRVVETFDADALGATQLAFDLESAPSSGLLTNGVVIKQLSCPNDIGDCRTGGFALMSDPTTNLVSRVTDDGPQLAPFDDFVQTDPNHGSKLFDTSALDAVYFTVDAGSYDFCISNFRFLNAEGDDVFPPGSI